MWVMVTEGISTVPNNLNLSYTSGVTNLLIFYPYDSLPMPNMWHFCW